MKILIAGDFSPKFELNDIIAKKEFGALFDSVRPYIQATDISIVNFETTVAAEKATPIRKCGPHLSAHPYSVEALKYAGFNTVTLANNHFYDYGESGMRTSIQLLEQAGIKYTGAGETLQEACRPLYISAARTNEGGGNVAIINCCEHEFSIVTQEHGGCNPLNPIAQFYAIQDARKNADHVVVIVHGGHEHYQLPSTRMQDTYRFFIDAGADAVINHHQHCFSGMELYNGKPIFYGLGNFLFDTHNKANAATWHDGYMVKLNFEAETVGFEIIPYRQCYGEMTVRPLADKSELNKFNTKFKQLCDIIDDSSQLDAYQRAFYAKQARGKIAAFEPYRGRLLKAAYRRNMLPSFIKGEGLAPIINYVECESHYDILRFALHGRLENEIEF